MIDTKHTPGPWRAAFDDDWKPLASESGEELCCLPHMAFDAVNVFAPKSAAGPHQCSWEEFQANALLIAAAPEMLQTLMEFVSMFPCVPGSIGDEVRQRARAAIAKACNVPVEELGQR